MSFKRVDECLPAWLRAEIEMMKSGASTKPAPSSGVVGGDEPSPLARPVLRVVSNSRKLAAHAPRARPTLGAVNFLRLVVDNEKGGRIARGGTRDPAYQRDREGTVSG